jgi:hypothetical protein
MAAPRLYAGRNIQPIVPQTGVLSGLGCGESYVSYNAAKLGALGITGSQAATGVKAGVSAGTSAAAVGASVAGAVGAGAAAGSVVPIIGTAIGAIVGLLASGILNRKDQEVQNFDQAVAIWQQNRLNALNIANKYLVLAGLFDLSLKNPHIPIYQKYGRMGEQRFVTDMANLIYQAALSGQITAKDTPQSIMDRVVQPWIDSWGLGPMQDMHGDLINLILLGMIAEYVSGAQNRWLARGGQYPFASVPAFPLQQIIARAATPAPPPPPVVAAPAPLTMLPMPAPTAVVPAPVAASPNTLQHDTNGSMPTPYGTFVSQTNGSFMWFPPGATSAVDIAYSPAHTGGAGTNQIQWTGSQVVATNSDGSQWAFSPTAKQFVQISGPGSSPATTPVKAALPTGPILDSLPGCAVPTVWNGTQCVAPVPAPVPLPAVPQQPLPTSGPPAGFSQVGTDPNGVAIFANPQGVLYTWNGSGMQIFSGTLANSGGNLAAQVQAAIQQALSQGQSAQQAAQTALAQAQSTGAPITQASLPALTEQAQATAAAPVVAGVGTDVGKWVAMGAAVLVLLFATARPMGNPHG